MSLFRSRKVRTVNLAVNKSLSQFVGYAQKEIAFYAVLVAPAVGDRYEKFQFQILCASCVMGASNSDVFVMRYLRLPLLVNGLISRGFFFAGVEEGRIPASVCELAEEPLCPLLDGVIYGEGWRFRACRGC